MTEEEFRAFIAARGSALRRTGYFLTGDWQLGEDLTQAALVATWRHLGRIRESAAAESYVRTAMTRTYLSWRRRRRIVDIPTATLTEPAPTADHGDEVMQRDRVWTALQSLPAAQRAALVLRYYEDLQVDAIASVLGVRPGTVKSHLSRGIAALRGTIAADVTKESS